MKFQPKHLYKINLLLLAFLLMLLVRFAYVAVQTEDFSEVEPIEKEGRSSLPYSFATTKESYLAIGEPLLSIESSSLEGRLPDLRSMFLYYGTNKRPDAQQAQPMLYFLLRSTPPGTPPFPIPANTKTYMKMERNNQGTRWGFSEGNIPTNVWLEANPHEREAEIRMEMQDSAGKIIRDPQECHYIRVQEMQMPYQPRNNQSWTVGTERVDGTLLLRQKAVWCGQDLFLQEYGDDEFDFARDRERIDFQNPENPYCVYVTRDDCLAFSDGQWHRVEPGPDSQGKTLLQVKNIDERAIQFDLWDGEGKNRILVELHRTPAAAVSAEIVKIKLVGARSKRKWIADVSGERVMLDANDWLLLQNGKWEKLTTEERIDDLISGKIRGPLLVLEGVEKVDNEQSLVGKLFNEMRNQVQDVQISLFRSWEKEVPPNQMRAMRADDRDDDEDDDEDDDDDDEGDEDDRYSQERYSQDRYRQERYQGHYQRQQQMQTDDGYPQNGMDHGRSFVRHNPDVQTNPSQPIASVINFEE